MVDKGIRFAFGAIWLLCMFATTANGQEGQVALMEVYGTVTDEAGKPVENAVVRAGGADVSAVLTDAAGKYRFFLADQKEPISLRVSKELYKTEFSKPLDPKRKLVFDAVLKPDRLEEGKTKVIMEGFKSGASISGRVIGIKPEEVQKYKVLVYVLTDKWYIHPYAENTEGRGYARVKTDGTWGLLTVNRGHHPTKLAMLVAPKDFDPPAVVAIEEDAEQALRQKFGSNLVSISIEKAPEGL
jgi:hypothetical protein